jgi:hypothetical protein
MSQNLIDQNGLQTKTLTDIIAEILNGTSTYPGLYQIYGPNINVGSNSPDGQLVNLFAQAAIDVEDFIAAIYASMDPDQATGVTLDSRCAINGVIRRAGTFTQQNILVTVTQAVTLPGLDTAQSNPFTVQDSSGNKFQLVATYAFGGAGNATLVFQAATMGAIQTTANTINQVVTVLLGVSTVNNPTGATVVGTSEESDALLRIRRSQSVSLPSKGYLEGLVGALLNTTNVLQAIVLENVTGTTDGNGIPGHSIWCIVLGGTDPDVAQAIYRKRNAGAGMKGSTTVNVTQIDSTVLAVKFDRPTAQNLWIKFTATAVTGTLDATYIRTQILSLLSYRINQPADASAIIALCKQIAANISYSVEGVSPDNVTYTPLLNPTGVNYQFAILSARIIINGTPGP